MFYYKQGSKLVVLILSYTAYYLVLMYIHFGLHYLWIFFSVFVMLFLLINLVLYLFNQKDAENIELQYYIEELQMANKKIEQLTLQNERQRMARDLHDTLAQRLVGLILKLDASEVHLQKGNYEKVESIIASAKDQAKESLRDARKVIDDLRLIKSNDTFQEQLQEEIAQLQFIYSIPIELKLGEVALSVEEQSHVLSIVKEAITNVYKHASASRIDVNLFTDSQNTIIKIRDNGIGIKLDTDLQKHGHYGILGMKERVMLMGGQLKIENVNGTCITIIIPVK
ncbi:MAG: sensor histidine kinase [Lysinibacillus sp.]